MADKEDGKTPQYLKLNESLPQRPAQSRQPLLTPHPGLGAEAFDAVTPGINRSAYESQSPPEEMTAPSYFSQTDRPLSSEGVALSPSEAAAGAKSGSDILKRMSLASLGRRESLTDIRDKNPDLALSGNIISATFNLPHSLKYRKGGDWVGSQTEI